MGRRRLRAIFRRLWNGDGCRGSRVSTLPQPLPGREGSSGHPFAFVAIGLVLALLPGIAAAQTARDAVARKLDGVLAKAGARTRVGLVVVDTKTGDAWYSHDADTPMKPASVMKLFTTAAALEHLGADFSYETKVHLCGDALLVIGSGDPSPGDGRVANRLKRPTNAIFEGVIRALKERGVSSVQRVILDDTVFDAVRRHPEWPDDQADRWYQAPVGGLNLNDNCLDVAVRVNEKRVVLDLTPVIPLRLIDNHLRVGAKHRPILRRSINSDILELSGTVRRDCVIRPAAVRDPTVVFAHAIKAALETGGVNVRGAVVQQDLPLDQIPADSLVFTQCTPLPAVLWRCNTFSQNMFAECLMKSLAAYEPGGERGRHPGEWDAGRSAMKRTLKTLGVDMTGAALRDGSGLSHSNRVTAGQITRLLVAMRVHEHADLFRATLAEPGKLGSMRTRYDDPALRGRLFGKTGTISGVRSLAGYVERADGTVLAFAVLANGAPPVKLPLHVARALVAE